MAYRPEFLPWDSHGEGENKTQTNSPLISCGCGCHPWSTEAKTPNFPLNLSISCTHLIIVLWCPYHFVVLVLEDLIQDIFI